MGLRVIKSNMCIMSYHVICKLSNETLKLELVLLSWNEIWKILVLNIET